MTLFARYLRLRPSQSVVKALIKALPLRPQVMLISELLIKPLELRLF